jgi:hypothetical protein
LDISSEGKLNEYGINLDETEYINLFLKKKYTHFFTIIVFLDIIHRPAFNLKQRFGEWILSPSSGENLLSWAQSTVLVPISGAGFYLHYNCS